MSAHAFALSTYSRTIITCDRCKHKIIHDAGVMRGTRVQATLYAPTDSAPVVSVSHYDLCPECAEDMRKWMMGYDHK